MRLHIFPNTYTGYAVFHHSTARALTAGFVATLFMTVAAYMAPLLGLPLLDLGGMLGSIFTGGLTPAL